MLVMRGESFFHQRHIGFGQWRVVQFECAADEKLPLADGQTGQFLKHFRETHGDEVRRKRPSWQESVV